MIRQLSTHLNGLQTSGLKFTQPYVASMIPILEKLRGTEDIFHLFCNSEFVSSIDPISAQKLVRKISSTIEPDEARILLSNNNLLEKLTSSEESLLVLKIIKNENPHISYDLLIDPQIGTMLNQETFNLLISYIEKGDIIQQICGLLTNDSIRPKLSTAKKSALLGIVKKKADPESIFEVISALFNDDQYSLTLVEVKPFLSIYFKKIIASEEISLVETFAIPVAKMISEQGTIEQKKGAYAAFFSASKKSYSDSVQTILKHAREIVRESSN